MRNKAKLEGELWDDRISSSSGQNTHMVSKATRLWESLLARKSKYFYILPFFFFTISALAYSLLVAALYGI